MLVLRTFGGLSIERSAAEGGGGSATSTATAARRRLAFLAVLAATGPQGVPRDKLLALFWPESDADRARHSLDQTLYALKRDLNAESLVLGREQLTINPAALTSDVEDFKAALGRGDRAAAVQIYAGPFLDGVYITGAPGFERWVEEERARLGREVESALEQLATDAAARGDHASSVQRWQRLATMEPRKTRVVLSLMSELAASGDRAGALRHAQIYDTLVRDDLDAKPNPAVAALADRLRREPGTGRAAPVAPVAAPDSKEVAAVESTTAPSTLAESVPEQAPSGKRLTTEWLRRRTTRAYRVAALAIGLAVLLGLSLLWAMTSRRRMESDRPWVVTADIENRTGDTVFDGALDAALAAGLQQSPYLSLFPRARVQQTLIRMGHAPAADGVVHLDESLAREVGQREGIHTVIVTTIDRIDSSYVLSARLVDATSGASIAAESRKANRRADVIDGLDDLVRRLRRDIGESPEALAEHDLPLPQATTRSLEALRAFARGNAAWVGGQRLQARELYQEAVGLDSDFALAHSALGIYYYWNNDRPNGDLHFDRALRVMDRLTDRERLQIRASAESWRGNRESAIEIQKALLALYPRDREGWAHIGYDYMRLGRPTESIAAYTEQIRRDSTDPAIFINMAVGYSQLTRYEEAVRFYQHAFALQPKLLTLENLNHEYGEALLFAGHPDQARAVYDSMLAGGVQQKARGHRSLGLLAMAEGHYGEATDRFRQAVLLTQTPRGDLTEARNRLFLASAEQEKGWRDSASMEMRTVVSMFRKSYFEPAFLMFLEKALARDGQLSLAREVLDTLRKRARPENPQDRVNVLVASGELAMADGLADSAVRVLRLASATDSSAFVVESLAAAIARAGDLPGAGRLYDELLAHPHRWYGWEAEQYALAAPLAAGGVYERAGDRPRARVAYERVLTRWARGDTDLVTMRASRSALDRLSRPVGPLAPAAR